MPDASHEFALRQPPLPRTLAQMKGRGRATDRVLATVMFTDIVGSTELAGRIGDRAWKSLLARHDAIVRRELKRFGGRELDTAGDGFFVLFDRPAQAIECARAINWGVATLDVQIRAAIHMGEAEVIGKKVGGIAVHAASRVLSMASPGEILVTGIVRDVVAGADIEFADRGAQELRGVPGEWHLFAVEPSATGPIATAGPDEDSRPGRRSWLPITAVIGAVAVVAAIGTAVVLASLSRPAPIVPHPNAAVRLVPATGAFSSMVEIDDPTEMTVVDGALWVLSVSGRTINRIDPQTRAVTPVGLPATPTGLAASNDAIWITTGYGAASGNSGVVRVATTNRQIDGTIPLGDGVDGIAVGDGYVWVTNRVTNTLARIDLATRIVSTEVSVGEQPGAVIADQGTVWVANAIDQTIWRLDSATMAKTAEISLAQPPHDIALGFDRLWITSILANSVIVVDAATNSIQQTLQMPGAPRGVVVGPDAIWVALSSGKVVRIDPQGVTDFQVFTLAGAPEDVAVDDGGVWISIRE